MSYPTQSAFRVLSEEDVPPMEGWGGVVLWGVLFCGVLYGIYRALFPTKQKEYVSAKRLGLKGDNIKAQKELLTKTPLTFEEVIETQPSLAVCGESDLKPSQQAIVIDDLSEMYNKLVVIHRIDSSLLLVSPVDTDSLPHIGKFIIERKYLKREARIRITYAMHGLEENAILPTTEEELYLPPLASLQDVKDTLGQKYGLTDKQFFLIHGGNVMNAMGELAGNLSGLLRVYVRKEQLAKGYTVPVGDPKKTEAMYRYLESRCEEMEEKAKNIPPGGVLEGNDMELLLFVRKYDKVVVDFYAPWCGPCRAIAPTFNAIANAHTGKVGFFKIDADKYKSAKLRFSVNGFPTFIMFRNGVEDRRMTGADENRLDAMVQSLAQY